ncbi:MAG TPA: hypothetical protein VF649_08780 [Sphingomonas sp.]|jgi:hypothetical protein|uniref:hypothetical protein n=1 Tax=Sphingomonas sp. TaxID=28214 RepID=UPI002EDBA981
MRPRFAFLMAALLATSPGLAQSNDCLSEAEARSVVAYALPAAIEATAARCRPLLPAAAWLSRNGAGMAQRYRRDGGGSAEAALPVLERLSGQTMPDFLDPTTLSTMVEGLITDRVRDAVATRDCPTISRIAEQISPLPLGNVASLLVALVQLDRRATSRTGIRICSAPEAGAR